MLTTVSPSHQCLSVCLSVFCMLLTLQSATSYKRLNSVLIVISVAVSCVRGGASPRNRRGYRVRCGEGIYPSTMAVKPVCLEVGFVVRFLKIIVITVNEGVISAPGRGGGRDEQGLSQAGSLPPSPPPKTLVNSSYVCSCFVFGPAVGVDDRGMGPGELHGAAGGL